MFNFTFSFSVPGLPNPFARAPTPPPAPAPPPPAPASAVVRTRPVLHARGSRKRGWEPAFAEPTTAMTASTRAEDERPIGKCGACGSFACSPLPPHAAGAMGAVLGMLASALAWFRLYRALAADAFAHAHHAAPEPKRRRTLAGSLLDGALSAALVGTAVGLTVYRLCVPRARARDRA
jgi:hypothetical protein